MRFLGSFTKFAEAVMEAAKKGGLSRLHLKKLELLLTNTGKRNLTLSKGILTALDVGGASQKDMEKFGELLERANARLVNDRKPFTKEEEAEISRIFDRAYISRRAARWMTTQMDGLVAEEMNEFLKGRKVVAVKKETIPGKKKRTV